MPAEHFAALMRRTQPNRSISEISKAAGLPWNRIGYYTRPDTVVDRMPSMASLREIARALDCEVIEVARAFAADIGLELEQQELDADEHELLDAYRRLSRRDQAALLAIARVLHDR